MTGTSDDERPQLLGPPLEVVERVWAAVLHEDRVPHDVGFFDLGATSVALVTVLGELRGRWPRLRLVDLFEHPNVNALSAFLAAMER